MKGQHTEGYCTYKYRQDNNINLQESQLKTCFLLAIETGSIKRQYSILPKEKGNTRAVSLLYHLQYTRFRN